MNKNKIYFWIVSFTALLMLQSCASSVNDLPEIPDIGIPTDHINKHFKIMAPREWNSFKIGDGVGLSVEVVGDNPIAFKSDYGAILFIIQDGQWVEIPNLMQYPEGEILLEPAKGDVFKTGAPVVDPILSDIHEPVVLRIILIGNIVKDKQITNEQVAGYIDVELKP